MIVECRQRRHPARRSAARLGAAWLLVAALAAAGCGGGADEAPDAARLVADGQHTFVAGDFSKALELFVAAVEVDPDHAGAQLGIARANHELHLYDEALGAYRRALELDPAEGLAWEGLVGALAWGGILEGNGSRLGEALDIGPEAVAAAPEAVELYDHLRTAAAELGRLDEYESILGEASRRWAGHPIVDIELQKARIEDARRKTNAAHGDGNTLELANAVAAMEASLRAELDALAARALTDAATSEAIRYKLAVGYDLLGDPERAAISLDLLEATETGRRFAQPLRYRQFLDEWISVYAEQPGVRLAVAERWQSRFVPSWRAGGSRHRAIEGMEFDLLVASVSESPLPGGPPPAEPSEEQLDRIGALGRRLARIDTWGGGSHYVEAARVLAKAPSHLVDAVRITDDGIAALEENRPGMIYPGTRGTAREKARLLQLAALKQLQGQALHNLGRDEEAERVIREAIEIHPGAGGYAVLGGLLLDQGRSAEAYDALVAALAHGFGPQEQALEEATRAAAMDAAGREGKARAEVERSVLSESERIELERDRALVADRLDIVAPEFELEDTMGNAWRFSELAGKVVVLNFWATWCGPCVAEFPHYQALVEEYAEQDDVVFLAISTDEDTGVVEPWLVEHGFRATVLYDRGTAIDYGVTGIPASFLIGPDGKIRYRTVGFPGAEQYRHEMRLRIEALGPAGAER